MVRIVQTDFRSGQVAGCNLIDALGEAVTRPDSSHSATTMSRFSATLTKDQLYSAREEVDERTKTL